MCNCSCIKMVPATNGYDFATSIVVAVCCIAACVVLGYFIHMIHTAPPPPMRKDE